MFERSLHWTDVNSRHILRCDPSQLDLVDGEAIGLCEN